MCDASQHGIHGGHIQVEDNEAPVLNGGARRPGAGAGAGQKQRSKKQTNCSQPCVQYSVGYGRGLQKAIDQIHMYDRLQRVVGKQIDEIKRLSKRRNRSRPFERAIERLSNTRGRMQRMASEATALVRNRYASRPANANGWTLEVPKRPFAGSARLHPGRPKRRSSSGPVSKGLRPRVAPKAPRTMQQLMALTGPGGRPAGKAPAMEAALAAKGRGAAARSSSTSASGLRGFSDENAGQFA
jgi:hypothetical protein